MGPKRPAAEMQEPLVAAPFGNWERHTQGIGMKLLSKMGFNGRLGATEQGVASAIQVTVRPDKAGLGAAQSDKNVIPRPEVKHHLQPRNLWKKDVAKYASLEKMEHILRRQEDQRTSESNGSETASLDDTVKETIVDMRGPCAMQIGDIQSAGALHSTRPLAKLMSKLRLLTDIAEHDQSNHQKKLKVESDRVDQADFDIANAQQSIKEEQKRTEKLSRLHILLDELSKCDTVQCVVLLTGQIFNNLCTQAEEKIYGLSEAVIEKATALTNQEMHDPTGSASKIYPPLFLKLKEAVSPDEYTRFAVRTLLVSFRRYLGVQTWNVRDPGAVVDALERWQAALPLEVSTVLAEQIIVPRLEREVSAWKPRGDSLPVHSWIFIWLPLLGKEKLQCVFSKVLQRFGAVITYWHPSDPTARRVLHPWSPVCDPKEFQEFLARQIVPKLASLFDGLAVERECAEIKQLQWCLEWDGLLSEKALGRLLHRSFFPLWLDSLLVWARTEKPSLEHISDWYQLSKGWFPKHLLSVKSIANGFSAGLDVISIVLSDGDLSSVSSNELLARRSHSSSDKRAQKLSHAVAGPIDSSRIGLRDLLSRTAEQNDLTFVPAHGGRTQEGHPVYVMGHIPIFIDAAKQIVKAQKQRNGPFQSISIRDLIAIAEQKS